MTTPKKLVYNDRRHSYHLDGRPARGITTVAGWPDDTTTLQQWSERQVLVGVATDENILRKVATAGNDWKALNDLTWEAKAAAKANEAADRGTAIHKMLEMVVTGGTVIETAELADVRARWERFVAQHEITVDPAWCERFAVHPADRICGRSDLIATYDGRLVVMDWKTGPNAVKYPHKTAIQLGLYANAPWFAVDGTADGDKTTLTTFEANPGVARDIGYVIDIPADDGPWRLVPVDIAAGWEQVDQLLRPMKRWRDRTDLVLPERRPAVPFELDERTARRVDQIKARKDRAGWARDNYPPGLPPVARIATAEQAEQLRAWLDTVETRFGEPPFDPPAGLPNRPEIVSTDVLAATPEAWDTMLELVLDLPGEARATLTVWADQAETANRSYRARTYRSVAIAHLAAEIARLWAPNDDDCVRATLACVYGEPALDPGVAPIGAWLGTLTTDEAVWLSGELETIANLPFTFGPDGAGRWVGAPTYTDPATPVA